MSKRTTFERNYKIYQVAIKINTVKYLIEALESSKNLYILEYLRDRLGETGELTQTGMTM